MKKWIPILALVIGIALMVLPVALQAQTAADKQVAISWDAGTEPDIQYYQLYVSSTGNDAEYGPAGDAIPFNPNDASAPTTLSTNYTFLAPEGETTTKWFKVTAIDTSGNESLPSEAASVTIDNQAPPAPTGLRIEILINVVQ
jgi:hypothetical protein